jgi:simple sugar transport system ATP-binding protein
MIGREMPPPPPHAAAKPGAKVLEVAGLDHPSDDPFGVPLSGVSLDVRAGEIVGIAGISGNGQKELAEVLSGEVALPSGQRDVIRMMDRAVGHLGAAARRKLGFAFVPEERLGRGAVPELPLTDNTLLTAYDRGLVGRGLVRRKQGAALTQACIEGFDVRTPSATAEAGALSGGNLQKFIMGREIMLEPRLLFVAQPTWGVDIGAATAIRRRLVALRDAGTAILMISEEIEELFETCDRLYVLHKGRLSPSLPVQGTTLEQVGEWMIGAAEEHVHA